MMKKYKTKTGKLTIALGCAAALAATVPGGCGMADAESKTESKSQIAAADKEADIQAEGKEADIKTADKEADIQTADTRNTDIRETESESSAQAENGTEPLSDVKDEFRREVTSESGGKASFGPRTTVVLDGETIDIKDRYDGVNGISDIMAVDGYWIVDGHISPYVGYYGFYNTETHQWDKEFFGARLTWYGKDDTDGDIPFSMDTVVYLFWNDLYDSNGTLLEKFELDENDEFIYDLKRTSTGVEVYIQNVHAEIADRMVAVDIPQTGSGASEG